MGSTFWERGFYRRPLAWCALAAAFGIAAAVRWQPPGWLWLVVVAAGAAALALPAGRGYPASALLLAAGVYGALAAAALAPPADLAFREGAAVTLRAEVLRIERAGGEAAPREPPRARGLLAARWRLVRGGWVPCAARVGIEELPANLRAGDAVEVRGRLVRPSPARNPGGFDARLTWLRRGAGWLVRAGPNGVRILGRRPPSGPFEALSAWARALRERILATNRATLSPEAALIANEFLIGDPTPPDPALAARLREAFRESGTIHLLVVSGTQVSLAAGAFLWLGWRFYGARAFWWSAGGAAIGFYYLLTEGEPAVQRAAVMGGALLLALLAEREPDGENCLGLAALVLLALQPLTLFDIGAQLSFAAVWGLIRLASPLAEALGPKPGGRPGFAAGVARTLAGIAGACIAAHLAVAPVLACHYQQASWSAIPANVLAATTAGRLMALDAAHAVLAPSGLKATAPLLEAHARELAGLAGRFSQPPFGAAPVFPPPLWLLPAAALLVAMPSVGRRSRAKTLLCVAALAGLQRLSETLPAPPPPVPTLRLLDVGQGDAILLQDPSGAVALVDAGPPAAGRAVARALRALRIPRLDLVAVSHADADHAGGLARVLEEAPVGLLAHRVREGGPEWRAALLVAQRRGVPVMRLEPGDRLRLGTGRLDVLGPLAPAPGERNEESLVLRWEAPVAPGGSVPTVRALLVGDAEMEAEERLLAWGPALAADLLKVGHHGSATSTGDRWLAAVRPRLALISCGRGNRFGHPAPETLSRLARAGIPVERTDMSGMLTLRLTATGLQVERYLRSGP